MYYIYACKSFVLPPTFGRALKSWLSSSLILISCAASRVFALAFHPSPTTNLSLLTPHSQTPTAPPSPLPCHHLLLASSLMLLTFRLLPLVCHLSPLVYSFLLSPITSHRSPVSIHLLFLIIRSSLPVYLLFPQGFTLPSLASRLHSRDCYLTLFVFRLSGSSASFCFLPNASRFTSVSSRLSLQSPLNCNPL